MRRKVIAGSLAALAVAGGTAGAIAASNANHDEHAVLVDAAKRLGVGADELRNALSAAENAQLDAAVRAGRITQAQADEIKRHREERGTVLGLGRPGGNGPGFRHRLGGSGPELMGDAAKAMGVTPRALFSQLRAGKTLEDVAKANGKTLADVTTAVKQSATARLDAALKAGDITQSQRDEEVAELDEEIAHLASGDPGRGGPRGFGRFGGGPPFFADAAKALGISEARLRGRLRAGDAKARAAVKDAAAKRLDAAVKAGRVTADQRAEMLAHLDEFGHPGRPDGPGFGHP